MPTVSIWQSTYQALPNIQADVVIIGAGISGVATAYWLRKTRPALRVVVLDAGDIAAGASGRNAGFLLQGTANDYATDAAKLGREVTRHLWQFTLENIALIQAETDHTAIAYRQTGSYVAAGTPQEAESIQAAATLAREDGFEGQWLPPQIANTRMNADRFYGALFIPGNGRVHSVKLLRYLAEKSGANFLPHHPVMRYEVMGEDIVIHTPFRQISAPVSVWAMNAWMPQLLPETEPWIQPIRAQMLSTAPSAVELCPAPIYSHEGYFYLRQDDAGALLLGGARHLHLAAEVGYEDVINPLLQADLEAYLCNFFPAFGTLRVLNRWTGTMGFSPDHVPCIGRLSAHTPSWWVGGYSGHGMSYGFRMGKLMAECALEGSTPELRYFDVGRFSA
ncbi:MAG: FAD-binding oxidoreductase [Bacteroidetes Order II. Incertae sedis bacterium]|nr:FAD-binding oxidoreductase [Bacteroidetes Order II. bacterium]